MEQLSLVRIHVDAEIAMMAIALCLCQEWIDARLAIVTQPNLTVTIFGYEVLVLVLLLVELALICHAHVGKAVLCCCVMRIDTCSTIMLELFGEVRFKVLPRILQHRVFNYGYTWIFTHLYLAFENLVGWRDALAAVALQAIERELTELNFALIVWTLYEA